MKYSPQIVSERYNQIVGNKEPCLYWKEMPKTKIWYDTSDNTFKSDVGVNVKFEGYDIDDIDICLLDLHDKIVDYFLERGISLHDA